jgi:hypothetical protein
VFYSCRRPLSPWREAQRKLYEISGGSSKSGDVRAAQLTTAQRIEYFKSKEFRDWVAFERSEGREVFWLKDVDKTQAAGDVFTFFFWWRVANKKFSPEQLAVIEDYLLARRKACAASQSAPPPAAPPSPRLEPVTLLAESPSASPLPVSLFAALPPHAEARSLTKDASLSPEEVQRLWVSREQGGEGLSLLDFWAGVYWPSQSGMTREEKQRQVREFAPSYADRVFPGVPEENRILEEAGVHVVIVSNGDQELAIAVSGVLGVKPENTVGSHLIYGEDGRAAGVNHSYEVFDKKWEVRPQPGKPLSFHYWLYMNRKRFGWEHLDEDDVVIAGRDGDSASSDGGMMILMQNAALGNFMVDTPGEPQRIAKFYELANKYGWTKGKFFTLKQSPSKKDFLP